MSDTMSEEIPEDAKHEFTFLLRVLYPVGRSNEVEVLVNILHLLTLIDPATFPMSPGSRLQLKVLHI